MNSTCQRYSRGGKLLELENMKNHYKNIIEPRRSQQMSQDNPRVNWSLNQKSKLEKIQARKYAQLQINSQENHRLNNALNNIKKRKGIIQLMSQNAKLEQKTKKNTNYEYHLLTKKTQLKRQNKILVGKIGNAKSQIGSVMEWQLHYMNFEKQKKKISRATQHIFNVNNICNTKNHRQINKLFRQTLQSHHHHRCHTKKQRQSLKKYRRHSQNSQNNQLDAQQMSILKGAGQKQQIINVVDF